MLHMHPVFISNKMQKSYFSTFWFIRKIKIKVGGNGLFVKNTAKTEQVKLHQRTGNISCGRCPFWAHIPFSCGTRNSR